MKSAASGLVAGINAARYLLGLDPVIFPEVTAIGSLARYITHADPRYFQPMNITFGLFPPIEEKVRKKREKNEKIVQRSLNTILNFT